MVILLARDRMLALATVSGSVVGFIQMQYCKREEGRVGVVGVRGHGALLIFIGILGN